MKYNYWKIEYTSCEGNYRWCTARTPADWKQEQVEDAIPIGGMGDDVASLIDVTLTSKDDFYMWDFK
jgi:hypothetical protein